MAGEIDLSNLPDPGGGAGAAGVDLSGLPDQGNDLASIRAGYADELNDPKVAGKLYALTHREVGTQGPEAQQAFVETVFNRAAARGLTLARTVSDPNYYPGVSLKPVAFTPDEVTRYQHMALNAAQGSNVSNYATGNASGNVGFAGGPQTARYGGERFGIEGPDRGWAQNYEQAARGVPVQQVDTYTRVEKAVPVREVEHEVARAYPVNGPRPPLPGGPDTLNQPPLPAVDLSNLPDQEEVPTFAPQTVETPPKDAPSLWQDTLDYFNLNKRAQPPSEQSIGAKILEQAGQKLQSLIPRSPLQWAGFATPAVSAVQELIKSGSDLPKEWENVKAGVEGRTLPHPDLAPKTYDKFTKDDWIKFGVDVGTDLLLGAAGVAGLKAVTAEPGAAAAAGPAAAGAEMVAAPLAAEAGAAAAPAGETAAAAARPIFTNVADELRWLRKNDPAEYARRFAEEIARRQQGEYDVRHDTEPATAPTQPAAAPPETPVEVPRAGSPAAPTVETQWQGVAPETRLALTDELAARGHSPAQVAALFPGAAANLVLQPAPDETVDLSGLPDQTHTLAPAQPGERPGDAWHGVQFLDQDRIKGELATIGFEPDQIDNMTKSQLAATAPAREAARAAPAAPAVEAAPEAPARAAKAKPRRPTKAEAAAEAEHRAEMERAGKEAISAQGGMDLLEAVAHEGGLPLKATPAAHPYRGELKMLRETIAGTKGVRYRDIFGGKSRGVDDLLLKLRARGFDFETPHELIAAIEHRIRTGTPHYALPEAGTALYGQPGLLKFSIEPISGERYFLPDETRGAFVETGAAAPELRNIEAELRRRHGIQARLAPVVAPAGSVRGLHPAIGKAEALARANGAKILWFRPLEASRLDTGEPVSPTSIHGGYSPGGRTIALNIDAAKASPVHLTAAHELGHYIKQRNPELYQELVKTLAEKAGGAEEKVKPYFAHLLGVGYEPGQLGDEMVNNFMAETLRNPGRFAEALGDRPNLAQRILTAIRDWIDRTLRSLGLRKDRTPSASAVMDDLKGARNAVMDTLARFREGPMPESGGPGAEAQLSMKGPLSGMERATLETLQRAKATLTPDGLRKLARLQARTLIQGEFLGNDAAFNLTGEQGIDWVARQARAEAEEAARVEREQAAQKAQMDLFAQPSMSGVIDTATIKESNGAGKGPPRAHLSMFGPNTPPGSNPLPVWAKRYSDNFRKWWQNALPRSYEIVRKVPGSPVITEHQRLLERELDYSNKFTSQPWWQALRRRPEEELVDLEHQAVSDYRRLVAGGIPRETAWSQAVSQMPPDMQALFQFREGRVPTERWAAGQLAVDEPSYTGDPYLARLTNEEGKAVVDLHPQIANWGRHIRQAIGSFDNSRVHATMKEGIQKGTQYEPPTRAAFLRELYSIRLEGTARMLKALKDKGVLFDQKADAIAAAKQLATEQAAKQQRPRWQTIVGGKTTYGKPSAAAIQSALESAGPVTLVRGFGGKDYWARTRVEAQFLAQNLNTTNSSGAIGKLVRIANAFTRNPNLMFNPLPHATKNMAFKYALARIGHFSLAKSAREFGTNAQMRARFEAVMPMPATGIRMPQLRALEAGTYMERILAKGGKWLSGNHFSARFNFAKADPALRYALWKGYVKKGLSDQAAANHVWVDLIRYDENSGALNFWRGIPFNFFSTWRLGTYISLAKQLRSHPIRTLLFIGAVEYLREILYRKYGWWTHLPVDYVDAPLAAAIEDPRTIPGVAATTLLFGPGGAQAPHTINDVMKSLHGDPGQTARVVNMFWGLSQLYNIPHEFNNYLKDKDPKHLAFILSSAALATHSALNYKPHRLMQWLPEWMPGMQKSAIVRQAEALQSKIQATQEKARGTYERRHGVVASFEHQTPEAQIEALRRSAGVHPPPPGPPKRTRVLPAPRSSGRPRGF